MITVDKMALVEAVLGRAADCVGDITDPVLARYYLRFPELEAAFERHGGTNRRALEGEMVERALYCLTEVIGETIPADEGGQREVWDELCRDLAAVIEQSTTLVMPRSV